MRRTILTLSFAAAAAMVMGTAAYTAENAAVKAAEKVQKSTKTAPAKAAGLKIKVIKKKCRKCDKRGGKAFKKYCRSCHDGSFKDAPVLTSKSKSSKQWETFFLKNLVPTHAAKKDPKNSGKSVLELIKKRASDMLYYLMNRAADKPSPSTCG